MNEWNLPKVQAVEFLALKPILNKNGIQVVGSNQNGPSVNYFMATNIAGDLVVFTFDGTRVQAKCNQMGAIFQNAFGAWLCNKAQYTPIFQAKLKMNWRSDLLGPNAVMSEILQNFKSLCPPLASQKTWQTIWWPRYQATGLLGDISNFHPFEKCRHWISKTYFLVGQRPIKEDSRSLASEWDSSRLLARSSLLHQMTSNR